MAKRPVYVFTTEELEVMLALLSNLDPEKYPSPKVKALINKCKSAKYDDNIVVRFTNHF